MNSSDFYSLFTSAWGILALILFFGGSIFVHELGHYLAARWRGLVIRSFSIGFGPRLFGWRRNGVDYKVSLLPLGGYVALPQLADMRQIEGGEDADFANLPPISYADRVIVALAGAVFNLIFALLLALVIWTMGRPTSMAEQTTTIGTVLKEIHIDADTVVPGPAYLAGLQAGDRIVAIDDQPVRTFLDIITLVTTGSGRGEAYQPAADFRIERDEEQFDVTVYPQLSLVNARSGDRQRAIGIYPAENVIVNSVYPHSPAAVAGLQPRDEIIAIDTLPVHSLMSVIFYLQENPDREVTLTVQRGEKTMQLKMTPYRAAVTKPLLRVSFDNGSALDILPDYNSAEGDLTDPHRQASLMVFDLQGESDQSLQPGDRIHSINHQPVDSLQDALTQLENSQSPIIGYQRGNRSLTLTLPDLIHTELVPPLYQPLLGFDRSPATVRIYPNPWEQFRDSAVMIKRVLTSLLTPSSDISINHLSGPVGISRIIYTFSIDDMGKLLWFVILLNINLAILNLLPIPVLDGGHILFATIAKLRGKALPPTFIGAVQGVFMLLIFGLTFYIIFFDSLRWIGDKEMDRELIRQSTYRIPVRFNAEPPEP